MNKRISALFLCVSICGGVPGALAADEEPSERSLFVSVLEEKPVLSDRGRIRKLVEFAQAARVQTLFVQVYRSNQAWFQSESESVDAFPYFKNLKKVGEDPLALLIREAHARGIQVHAWLNLLSLSGNTRAPLLQKYGPEILTRNARPKTKLSDYRIDNQFFLEPGDPRVTDALAAVVGELVRGYPELDGVQFDYIRYPDWKPAYGRTEVNERRFLEATGLGKAAIAEDNTAWQAWKRAQVTGFVERLAREVRALRPGLEVSTTGLVPYSRANLEAYQDWRAWVRGGVVDFVTLMCYAKDEAGFEHYLRDARRQFDDLKKVNFAVGAYRFSRSPAKFKRQWKSCEDASGRGCAAFFYGNLVEHPELRQTLVPDPPGTIVPRREK